MAELKISQLPTVTDTSTLNGSETFIFNKGGVTYREVGTTLFQWLKKVLLIPQSANYTLALADAFNGVAMNVNSANTVTVPLNSTVAFPIGTCLLIQQAGTGATTISAASGVTLNYRGGSSQLAGQFAVATLIKTGTNAWTLTGDLYTTNTGMSNPMTAAGDIIVGGSSGTPTRLGKGTDGQVLTLASGTPAWSTPSSGGGGLTNFTDSISTSSPNDTVSAAQFKATGTATDIDAVVSPKGNGALLAQTPDNGTSGGNKRGIRAVDLQQFRTQAPFVASGNYSAILGGRSNTVSATGSSIAGGNVNSITSGNYSFIGGGEQNSIPTGSGYSVVVGGYGNTTGRDYGFIGSGTGNTLAFSAYAGFIGSGGNNSVSGSYGAVISGSGNNITGDYGLAHGDSNTVTDTGCIAFGSTNVVSGPYSIAIGLSNTVARYGIASGMRASTRGIWGARAHGMASNSGSNQSADYILIYDTTDGTPVAITANGSGASSTNQIKLEANQASSCSALVVARLKGSAGIAKMWELKFGVMTNSPNSNIALIGTPIKTIIGQSSGTEAWDINVQVDSGNGAVSLVATGAASTQIRWNASVTTSEVMFS